MSPSLNLGACPYLGQIVPVASDAQDMDWKEKLLGQITRDWKWLLYTAFDVTVLWRRSRLRCPAVFWMLMAKPGWDYLVGGGYGCNSFPMRECLSGP